MNCDLWRHKWLKDETQLITNNLLKTYLILVVLYQYIYNTRHFCTRTLHYPIISTAVGLLGEGHRPRTAKYNNMYISVQHSSVVSK